LQDTHFILLHFQVVLGILKLLEKKFKKEMKKQKTSRALKTFCQKFKSQIFSPPKAMHKNSPITYYNELDTQNFK